MVFSDASVIFFFLKYVLVLTSSFFHFVDRDLRGYIQIRLLFGCPVAVSPLLHVGTIFFHRLMFVLNASAAHFVFRYSAKRSAVVPPDRLYSHVSIQTFGRNERVCIAGRVEWVLSSCSRVFPCSGWCRVILLFTPLFVQNDQMIYVSLRHLFVFRFCVFS